MHRDSQALLGHILKEKRQEMRRTRIGELVDNAKVVIPVFFGKNLERCISSTKKKKANVLVKSQKHLVITACVDDL